MREPEIGLPFILAQMIVKHFDCLDLRSALRNVLECLEKNVRHISLIACFRLLWKYLCTVLTRLRSRSWIASAIVTMLLIGGTPATSSAKTPATKPSTGISACVNKKTGSIRVVQKCLPTERTVSWSTKGAKGSKGAKGDPGIPGAPGNSGKNGASVLSGTGVPSTTAGVDGDFYIDTATYTFYGPKTSSGWGTSRELIGPAGLPGAAGGQGPMGPAGPPGAVGPVGPAGQNGTNSSMIWLSPSDLVRYPDSGGPQTFSLNLYLGSTQTKTASFAPGDNASVFRALPNGWAQSTSVTVRIYWVSLADGVEFIPEIYMGYLQNGADMLRDDLTTCTEECGASARTSVGANQLNITASTRIASNFLRPPTEGGMIGVSVSRTPRDGYNPSAPGPQDGSVLVLGVSISANFS